jgi:hypothetical protein
MRFFSCMQPSKLNLAEAERLVRQNEPSQIKDERHGHVYSGYLFRGDTRHYSGIFALGFLMRGTPTLRDVNGFRGGFGAGRDAFDPDGQGISTSPFYRDSGAGAYFYGGHKGGYTYFIDARSFSGYDLYTNWEYSRSKSKVRLRPWEINFGRHIPGRHIVGAFDEGDDFIPNPHYRPTSV